MDLALLVHKQDPTQLGSLVLSYRDQVPSKETKNQNQNQGPLRLDLAVTSRHVAAKARKLSQLTQAICSLLHSYRELQYLSL